MKLNNRQRAKLTLDELEKEMEILTKEEMNACKGGGSGTQTDPYTQDEFYMLDSSGVFTGGYVQGWGYVQPIEGIAVFHEDKTSRYIISMILFQALYQLQIL